MDVETVFTHSLTAYPAQIAQSEKQFVRFTGNAYFYSPYSTTTQTTVVNCASSTVESYSKVKPVAASESSVTYGPYENKDAFSSVSILSSGVTFYRNAQFRGRVHRFSNLCTRQVHAFPKLLIYLYRKELMETLSGAWILVYMHPAYVQNKSLISNTAGICNK